MAEHLKMRSMDKIDENIGRIAALFPNCVTKAKDDDGYILPIAVGYEIIEGANKEIAIIS